MASLGRHGPNGRLCGESRGANPTLSALVTVLTSEWTTVASMTAKRIRRLAAPSVEPDLAPSGSLLPRMKPSKRDGAHYHVGSGGVPCQD